MTLGCGEYEAMIVTRGGARLVKRLPFTSLQWGRVVDDTSAASVTGLVDDECCGALAEARTWKHEIAIYRDGALVWVGPLVTIGPPSETYRVEARDLSAWWDHRFVHNDHTWIDADLSVIFQEISEDAMAPDNTPGITFTPVATGVLATREVKAAQHLIAGAELRSVAEIGIDWTVVVRGFSVGGSTVPQATVHGTFVDDHFVAPPLATDQGLSKANRQVVAGGGTGTEGDTLFGDVADADAGYDDGLLEAVESDSAIADQASVDEAARSRLALKLNPITVTQAVLAPTAPFMIQDLVAGYLYQLELAETCLPVSGRFRLLSVQVSRDQNDERVSLSFEPVGSV